MVSIKTLSILPLACVLIMVAPVASDGELAQDSTPSASQPNDIVREAIVHETALHELTLIEKFKGSHDFIEKMEARREEMQKMASLSTEHLSPEHRPVDQQSQRDTHRIAKDVHTSDKKKTTPHRSHLKQATRTHAATTGHARIRATKR